MSYFVELGNEDFELSRLKCFLPQSISCRTLKGMLPPSSLEVRSGVRTTALHAAEALLNLMQRKTMA